MSDTAKTVYTGMVVCGSVMTLAAIFNTQQRMDEPKYGEVVACLNATDESQCTARGLKGRFEFFSDCSRSGAGFIAVYLGATGLYRLRKLDENSPV